MPPSRATTGRFACNDRDASFLDPESLPFTRADDPGSLPFSTPALRDGGGSQPFRTLPLPDCPRSQPFPLRHVPGSQPFPTFHLRDSPGSQQFHRNGPGSQQFRTLSHLTGPGSQQFPTIPHCNGLGSQQFRTLPHLNDPGSQQFPTIPHRNGPGSQPFPMFPHLGDLCSDSPVMIPNLQVLPSPTTGYHASLWNKPSQTSVRRHIQENIIIQREEQTTEVENSVAYACFYAELEKICDETRNSKWSTIYPFDGRVNQTGQPQGIQTLNSGSNPLHSRDKKHTSLMESIKPLEDVYNWRKYGKKDIKKSQCPKSYYKCTHINCKAKKMLVHSLDGRLTIIYDGAHNHSETQPGHNPHGEYMCRNMESTLSDMDIVSGSDFAQKVSIITESEEDLIDDGYRWRKYGQKVVKVNPNPRNYYKCTSKGCPVKKQIERVEGDLKLVLTTYEGEHNHQVPT